MYSFNYQRPTSVAQAGKAGGEAARFLAGGQSLVQAMRLRLSQSDTLVDLGGLDELRRIEVDAQGVTIGAMATHASVAANAQVRAAIPALAELAGGIGDPMVRNMGTIGGSIANADPAACYPAAVVGLECTVQTSQRSIPGDDFFKGLFETALQPGELITSVRFAKPARAAYVKFRQPASRFALVGVFVSEGPGGVRVGVTGARACAYRAKELEAALAKRFAPESLDGIVLPSAGMNADLHASAQYRAAMVVVMARRAVAAAIAR